MQQLRLFFAMALLYMFRVTIPTIIRSTMLYMAFQVGRYTVSFAIDTYIDIFFFSRFCLQILLYQMAAFVLYSFLLVFLYW